MLTYFPRPGIYAGHLQRLLHNAADSGREEQRLLPYARPTPPPPLPCRPSGKLHRALYVALPLYKTKTGDRRALTQQRIVTGYAISLLVAGAGYLWPWSVYRYYILLYTINDGTLAETDAYLPYALSW